jgi:F-type H+-transporting ATPase subunit b
MNTLYDIFTGISEGSFGINTDIFETNIINLVIFVSAIFVFGSKALGEILSNRQQKVVSSIQEAEERLQQAEVRLAEAQKQLDQINMVVESIKTEAQTAGTTLQTSILMQGKEDIERLTANAKSTISNTEVQVKRQILQQITALTIQRVSSQFKEVLNFEMQARIIDRGIAELGV